MKIPCGLERAGEETVRAYLERNGARGFEVWIDHQAITFDGLKDAVDADKIGEMFDCSGNNIVQVAKVRFSD